MTQNNHDSIVLKFGVQLLWRDRQDVQELGRRLSELGTDDLTEAGFWIWEIPTDECYYSQKFKDYLGFDDSFPKTAAGFMQNMVSEDLRPGMLKTQMMMESKSKDVFINVVRYKTEAGIKGVVCSGTIIYDKDDKPSYVVGTHQILNVEYHGTK